MVHSRTYFEYKSCGGSRARKFLVHECGSLRADWNRKSDGEGVDSSPCMDRGKVCGGASRNSRRCVAVMKPSECIIKQSRIRIRRTVISEKIFQKSRRNTRPNQSLPRQPSLLEFVLSFSNNLAL